MEQFEDITYDPSEQSQGATSETLTATRCNYGTGPARGERWHVCPTCSASFPESEMLRRKGSWYCKEDGEDWLLSDSRKRR